MEKNYKEKIISLGISDYAQLVLVGMSDIDVKTDMLRMGEDGSYSAYLIDDGIKVPNHYHSVNSFKNWLKIYDDFKLVQEIKADFIEIYRAGNFGILIKAVNKKKMFEVNLEYLKIRTSDDLKFKYDSVVKSFETEKEAKNYVENNSDEIMSYNDLRMLKPLNQNKSYILYSITVVEDDDNTYDLDYYGLAGVLE